MLRDIESRGLQPEVETHKALVEYLCKHGTVEAALDHVERSGLGMTEHLAWLLIYAYSSGD